jgi:hypothetical protein
MAERKRGRRSDIWGGVRDPNSHPVVEDRYILLQLTIISQCTEYNEGMI